MAHLHRRSEFGLQEDIGGGRIVPGYCSKISDSENKTTCQWDRAGVPQPGTSVDIVPGMLSSRYIDLALHSGLDNTHLHLGEEESRSSTVAVVARTVEMSAAVRVRCRSSAGPGSHRPGTSFK